MYTVEQRLKNIRSEIDDMVGDKTQPVYDIEMALMEIAEQCQDWLGTIEEEGR